MSYEKNNGEEMRRRIISQLTFRRLKKGISQKQLAEMIGTSKSNISRIESGSQNITLDMLLKIANALNDEVSMKLSEPVELQYDSENTDYSLRLYDEELLQFKLLKSKGLRASITYINEENKHLLPLDLELTEEGLIDWLKHRTIPSNRQFVGDILQAVGLDVNDLKGTIDICKGLSLNDSYWIVPQNFKGAFAEYNLYENRFDELLGIVAYTGAYHNAKNFGTSPELTTGGMLRKAWRYDSQGDIWMYKGGTEGFANTGNEPFSEYYAYQVADKMGITAVRYELENWKGILASKCKLFTDINTSYIPIGRIIKEGGIYACLDYCKSISKDAYDDLCSMIVFDAVIYNEDRHFGNFGMLRDNRTGNIIGLAPIFDNGISLFCYGMKDDFQDIEKYASQRTNPYGIDYLTLCRGIIGHKQKAKLRKLINFKFERSDLLNLPEWRLEKIEHMIHKRVEELLTQ